MKNFFLVAGIAVLASCSNGNSKYDASGTFESDEVIVSAEQNGQLLVFNVQEGDSLAKELLSAISIPAILCYKSQVQATIQSFAEKTTDVGPQVQLLKDQLAVQHTQPIILFMKETG